MPPRPDAATAPDHPARLARRAGAPPAAGLFRFGSGRRRPAGTEQPGPEEPVGPGRRGRGRRPETPA